MLGSNSVSELKALQAKYGIQDKNIKGTGKNGNILKEDRVKAIRNYKKSKKEKKSKDDKKSKKNAKNKKEKPKVKKCHKRYETS